MIRSIFFLFLIFGFTFPLFAQGGESLSEGTSNIYALVVGISKYEDPNIADLDYAHIDAQKFADFLHSPAGGNIPEENIHRLIGEEATMGAFQNELMWLAETTQAGDKVYLFFSGHAQVQNTVLNKGYFMLYNTKKEALAFSGYEFDRLSYQIEVLNSKKDPDSDGLEGVEVILIFDACHSGTLEQESAMLQMQGGFKNTIRLLSCKPDQDSEEGPQWGGGRGAFSYHLLAGLVGNADKAPVDGFVTLKELEDYLENTVPKEVKNQQNPQIKTALDDDYLIAVVDEATFKSFNEKQDFSEPVMGRSKWKGQKDVIEQAGSQVQEWYTRFEARLDEGKLLQPAFDCADYYYNLLIEQEELSSVHNFITGNFAAVLQDATVDGYRNLTDVDLVGFTNKITYEEVIVYQQYLERAIDLLGPDHYIYETMLVRKRFLEGVKVYTDYRGGGNKEEDLLKGIDLMEEVVQLQPDQALAYIYLGELYTYKGDMEKVEKCFDDAIRFSPQFSYAYGMKGHLYSNDKSWLKAKEYWEKALEFTTSPEFQWHYAYNIAVASTNHSIDEPPSDWSKWDKQVQEELNRAEGFIANLPPEQRSGAYNSLGVIYTSLASSQYSNSPGFIFPAYFNESFAAQACSAYQNAASTAPDSLACGYFNKAIEIMAKMRRSDDPIETVYEASKESCTDEKEHRKALFYLASYYFRQDEEKALLYFQQLYHTPSGEQDAIGLLNYFINDKDSPAYLIPYYKYLLEMDPDMDLNRNSTFEERITPRHKTLKEAVTFKMWDNWQKCMLVLEYYPENRYPFDYLNKHFVNRVLKKEQPEYPINQDIEKWKQYIEIRPAEATPYFQLATILYEWERSGEAEVYIRNYYQMNKGDKEGVKLLKNVLKKNGKKKEVKALLKN
jgi:tetratricopeptide (TPR) repeat protein